MLWPMRGLNRAQLANQKQIAASGQSRSERLLWGVSRNITFLISDLPADRGPAPLSTRPLAWSRLTHLFKIVRADKFLSQVSSL